LLCRFFPQNQFREASSQGKLFENPPTGALRVTQHRFAKSLPLLGASVAILSAHLLLNALFPQSSANISYLFFAMAAGIALAACIFQSVRHAPMRVHWLLVASGVGFWFIANLIEAIDQIFHHVNLTTATAEDFFYFFFGVPFLLAIVVPDEEELRPAFLLLDGLQVVAAGYLAYVVLFAVLPFTNIPRRPISVNHLVLIFDAENFILALLATLRLFLGVRSSTEHRFFTILSIYLWLNLLCTSLYNHLVGIFNSSGPLDPLIDIPFALLAVAAVLAFPGPEHSIVSAPSAFSLFIDNVRPVFLGLALVALCAMVAGQHLLVATGFIFGAFVLYAARAALLHNRFLKTQFELEQARDRLTEMALQDGLTGIANRRCFDQRLASEWSRARRHRRPLSLLLIDVDNFKQINDTHGHLIGDEYLKQLARSLRAVLHRAGDLVARYGGEEFAILLPETASAGACALADNVRLALSEIPPPNAAASSITVSIGVATWEGQGEVPAGQILEVADKALYQAKQNGRDRVEFQQIGLPTAAD
jgi:diguanylate cyclase (GGDEF)-like protein